VTNPFLSLILPAHNEEHRLPSSLEKINAFLKTQSYSAEVIVVDNGSSDHTFELLKKWQTKMTALRILHLDERGKGLAVCTGMLAATGQYRFFADADLSMPVEEINHFIPPVLKHMDVAIASREAPGARRFNEPFHRHLIGRIFNVFVRWTLLPGIQDTQCGFKCFRADVAEDVFQRQTLKGMSFDAEMLFIARERCWNVVEVPISWHFDADSRVKLFKDSARMAVDILTIRRNHRLGRYA
jgi:dolichyl-phosphate beta-glucosyltransferase